MGSKKERHREKLLAKEGLAASKPDQPRRRALFQKRLNRTQYSGYAGALVVLVVGANFIRIQALQNQMLSRQAAGLWLLGLVVMFLLGEVVLLVKRYQDIGWSKWWLAPLFLPVVSFPYILLITVWPGERQRNRYGETPPRTARLWYIFCVIHAWALAVVSIFAVALLYKLASLSKH